jgi:hypothetical protein
VKDKVPVSGQPVATTSVLDVTVTALDTWGNIDVNYRGTVTFSVTDGDPGVIVPNAWTFTGDDAGVHTFSAAFVLITLGDQTLTVVDDGGLSGSVIVTVRDGGGMGPGR